MTLSDESDTTGPSTRARGRRPVARGASRPALGVGSGRAATAATTAWPGALLVAGLYLGAWLALDLVAGRFSAAPGVSVWYPPAGLDIVVLMLFGLRYAPLLMASTVLHIVLVEPVGLTWVQVLLYGAITTVGYTAAVALLLRLQVDPRLTSQRDTGVFVGVACAAGPLGVAAAQVGVLVWAGVVPAGDAALVAAGYWAGAATGIGMLAPALLVTSRRWSARWEGWPPPPPDSPGLPVSRGEHGLQLLLLVATAVVAYGLPVGPALDYTYLVYVPMIWIAVRGGFSPIAYAVLAANVTAAVSNGGRVPGQGGIALQFGLVTLTLVALLLGSLITQRRVDAERHRHASLHDPLTGLPNRALFTDRLSQALARALRHPGDRSAVLFVDLDRFKTVNDSLGHTAGDLVLVEVGRRLRAVTRPSDTVSRLGGDEFAVLAEPLSSPDDLTHLVERIQSALEAPHFLAGERVTVTASIGSVLSPSLPTSPDQPRSPSAKPAELLRDADVALHRAKGAGTAQHVEFATPMHASALDRRRTEEALRRAVDPDDTTETITLVFQPILDLATRRVVAREALARWQPGGRGPVAPEVFVRMAEDTGLIHALGRLVLRQACSTAARWPHADGTPSPTVAVNVSPLELRRPDYADTVRDVLAETGLPASRLELEVTEVHWLHHQQQTVSATLGALRDIGVGLVVDDFGSGYASFGYLGRVPLAGLKIDRSFTARLPGDRYAAAVVRGVLVLADELDLPVTAEGIESPDQLEFLSRHGCRLGQGTLLGAPEPLPPTLAGAAADRD